MKQEKEKSELLAEENRHLREQLEQANKLNQFLTAKIALKDIYSRSGSEWYTNEGSMQAKNTRNAMTEFENNNNINSKEYDNIDFNSIYMILESDNQINRDAKRKNIVMILLWGL